MMKILLMPVDILDYLSIRSELFKKENMKKYLASSFGWITAIILVLMCPVDTQLYALGMATFFAIFVGRILFGGFGQNIFNPAAVGFAIIFASFAGSKVADVATGATPISTMATGLPLFIGNRCSPKKH